jgi:HK97 family phage prohead protease
LAEGYGAEFLSHRHAGIDADHKRPTWVESKTLEHRITPRRVEVRTLADGTPVIRGYAAVYDYAYDVAGGPAEFGWRETIVGGAIGKSVREQDEVYLFFDHDGLPLAATKAGTLSVESDKIGFFGEARLDQRSQYSMEVFHRVERGELDAMSWAFQAMRQEWNADYTERRIIEAKAFDQSIVSFPANPATVVGAHNVSSRMAEMQSILAELRST